MRRDWYRLHDVDPRGAILIPGDGDARDVEADRWNRQGYGIFWTLNEFNGPRQIANLARIHAWAVDMDAGTKADMRSKLSGGPLVPSLVVETRRGYQCYFDAREALPERWNAIVLERLVPYFGADKNARDLARILRVPGFLHLKDPTQPFECRTVWRHAVSYTERQMVEAFPCVVTNKRHAEHKAETKREHRFKDSDGFWDRVYSLDCEEGLSRIAGFVGESYSFKQNRSGTKNIIVNGKSTSCWIDRHGRIGSLAKGGPTLFNWLRWYGHSPRECVDMLKRAFPALERPR